MVVAIIQGLVRAAALGGSAALGACVPRLLLFCLRWAFLGFTSCCVAGCGAANLLLFLVPYVRATAEAAGSPDLGRDAGEAGLAIFCYGIGSVLGEVPLYFAARELGSRVRRALDANKSDLPFLKLAHSYLSPRGADGTYWPLVVASLFNPLPIDATSALCAVCGTPFLDFFLASIVGKGILRTRLLLFFFERSIPTNLAFRSVDAAVPVEVLFALTAAACVAYLIHWRANFTEMDFEIDDDDDDDDDKPALVKQAGPSLASPAPRGLGSVRSRAATPVSLSQSSAASISQR
ncbi:hypothetical protein DIPPA_32037 [Diplonema papillatum]|nr:hypothetical protein DIPPA_32037 [Diplonema papillatum]